MKLQSQLVEPDLRRVGVHPDFWHPVAQSHRLGREKTLGVTFAGEPIVLVRTKSGRVFAVEDRCAHRQVPLHLGVVQGERLLCGYHSWCYDETGAVCGIPYLPKGHGHSFRVKRYPCREDHGLVFVFPGDPEKAERAPFPELPYVYSPKYKTMRFYRQVNCHYSFMHENLMDMNHQFLHRKLMENIKVILLDIRKGQDWVEVDYKFDRVQKKRLVDADMLMLGTKDPDPSKRTFDIMTIRTQYPYQTLTIRRPSLEDPALHLWATYTPIDAEQRTCTAIGLLTIRRPGIPGLINLFWPVIRYFTERIFTEDRMAVEAEQRAHDLQGADWNNEVYPATLELRRVLRQNGVPAASGTLVPSSIER